MPAPPMLNRQDSKLYLTFLFALLLGAVLMGAFVSRARPSLSDSLIALLTGRSHNTVTAPVVVEQMQRLSRLETVSYSLDTVVEGNESNPVIPDVLAGDRLLMIVHGQTVAGVDLSKLSAKDIDISDTPSGRAIRLKLPAAEIFHTAVDDAKSRVYERTTGIFVRADPNLETQTRLNAQQRLQQAALADGILSAAAKNAVATITVLLQGFGFAHVEVR